MAAKYCKKLDLIIEEICRDGFNLAKIKKKISSLKEPGDIIYVGNEIWWNLFEKDLKCSPEIISFLRDVIYKANERTRKLSTRDYLTGLFNRRFLDSKLKMQLASTYRSPENSFSVIMFDIDYFKKFNDIYGHNAGDVVLKTLSGVVSESIRDSDVAFRYGGEEFLVLLPDTNRDDALDVAYRLNNLVANTDVKFVDEKGEEHRRPVTVSVGVMEINKENPIWLLYGTRGRKLVFSYVNNDSGFDEMLEEYVRKLNHSSSCEKLKIEDVRRRVKIIGEFVRSYIAENNLDICHIPVLRCAPSWVVKGADDLVYYAKKCGRNCVTYINGGGVKIVEKSKRI